MKSILNKSLLALLISLPAAPALLSSDSAHSAAAAKHKKMEALALMMGDMGVSIVDNPEVCGNLNGDKGLAASLVSLATLENSYAGHGISDSHWFALVGVHGRIAALLEGLVPGYPKSLFPGLTVFVDKRDFGRIYLVLPDSRYCLYNAIICENDADALQLAQFMGMADGAVDVMRGHAKKCRTKKLPGKTEISEQYPDEGFLRKYMPSSTK